MTFRHLIFLPLSLIGLFLVIGCEKPVVREASPEPRSEEVVLSDENTSATENPFEPDTPDSEPEERTESKRAAEGEVAIETEDVEEMAAKLEPEPELRVFWEEGAIVIEGALKSKIQRERIESQLGNAFSGTRIENRLVLDYDRFPVGWGNRVTEGFLIPYFDEIEDARVEYANGVITLKGKGTRVEKTIYQKLAGVVFQGMLSREIDNQIITD